ncbi:MAG: CpaF family protein [Clostridiales bacterium]|jgi:pilus assembly protein CpaF|nr:CpaF family protein [Clostridiales bacterium]
MQEIFNVIKDEVVSMIDLYRDYQDEEIIEVIDEVIVNKSRETYISVTDKRDLRRTIFNSIRRYDVLQDLIEDITITEIMINGANKIFIEQDGVIKQWDKHFESDKKLEDIIQAIVSKSNRIINEANPIVDARLLDGSRVNVVLPPVSLDGCVVTIRRFPDKPINMNKLIQYGSLTRELADYLEDLVIAGYNIFVSGGTGSGKTTFLNVLSNYIPSDERVITIEDSAELQIQNIPNLVRLEVRNANVEGKGRISIRDLIKSSMRMRPDRIVVGEVRDEAAIDMLQAMNSGHDGSLSTGHANSAIDMLIRLETLVLMGIDIPLIAVRKQIVSAIDIVVHLGRLRDKTRKVIEVSEVLDCIDGDYVMNQLFVFEEVGEDEDGKVLGEIVKTKNSLINDSKLRKAGIV